MFSSCLACTRPATSEETNPAKAAGLDRLHELRDAIQETRASTRACMEIATSLQKDLRNTPGGKDYAGIMEDTWISLKGFDERCSNSLFELKCFTRYFGKSFPKADSNRGLIDPKETHLNHEVSRRGEFADTLATAGRPVAQMAEQAISRAASVVSKRPALSMTTAVQNLERVAQGNHL